jgi:spore germination cell wall hydrolase CwlJ-like protein
MRIAELNIRMRKFIDAIAHEPTIIEEGIGTKIAAAAIAGALSLGTPSKGSDNTSVPSAMDSAPTSADTGPMDSDNGSEPADAPKNESLSFLASIAEQYQSREYEYRAFMREATVKAEHVLEDENLDEGLKTLGMTLMFAGLAAFGGLAAKGAASVPTSQQQYPNSDAWPDFGSEEGNALQRDDPGSAVSSAAMETFVKQAAKINQLSPEIRQEWAYLTMTIWAEARSGGPKAMLNVGNVMRNRLETQRWGTTYKDVVTARKQFSCWNPSDPNRQAMFDMIALDTKIATSYGKPEYNALVAKYANNKDFAAWIEAKKIAWKILNNNIQDTTGGADHYHTVTMSAEWNTEMATTGQDGIHVFFDSSSKKT